MINSLILLLLMLLNTSAVIAASNNQVGGIKGQVNYCSQGGKVGMQIFIPGRQFMVLSGKDGKFLFEGVPSGKYEINYVVGGELVNANFNVMVIGGHTTDLGTVAFCDKASTTIPAPKPTNDDSSGQSVDVEKSKKIDCAKEPDACIDNDKDGVIAAQDCNDNDASIYPGAIERCDGIDNNCDGKVDDVELTPVKNGMGLCKASKISVKTCVDGFADCDGKAENGCETDINNDNENCGACFNQCSAEDFCILGIC